MTTFTKDNDVVIKLRNSMDLLIFDIHGNIIPLNNQFDELKNYSLTQIQPLKDSLGLLVSSGGDIIALALRKVEDGYDLV